MSSSSSLTSTHSSFTEEEEKEIKKHLEAFASKVEVGARYPDEILLHSKYPLKLWNSLDKVDQEHLIHFQETYDQKLIRAVLSNNSDKRHNTLGGHVLVVSPDAKVLHHHTNLSSQPFQYTMLAHVPIEQNAKLNDRKFKDSTGTVVSSVRKLEDVKNAPSIAAHFDSETSSEKASWKPGCYGDDSRISYLYTKIPKTGEKRYFVMASSNAGPIIASELDSILRYEQPTAAQFATDPRVLWANEASRRNTQYLLSHAAKMVGVELASVKDTAAHVPMYHDTPKMAVPDVVVASNTVNYKDWRGKVGKAVAFYNNCADGDQGSLSTLILSDPGKSVVEYQGANVGASQKKIPNAHFNMLPTHTSALEAVDMSSLPASTLETVASRICTTKKLSSEELLNLTHEVRDTHNHEEFKPIAAALGLGNSATEVRYLKPVLVCLQTQN